MFIDGKATTDLLEKLLSDSQQVKNKYFSKGVYYALI